LDVLYEYGRSVVLESEYDKDGIKTPDGYLDGKKSILKALKEWAKEI